MQPREPRDFEGGETGGHTVSILMVFSLIKV